MDWAAFTDASYRLETVSAGNARAINMYSEVLEQGPRQGKKRLRGIPGLGDFCTLPTRPVRCLWSNSFQCFAVAGGMMYEIFRDGSFAAVGPVAPGTNPAIIQSNGFQLAIASAGFGFIAPGGAGVIPIIDTSGQPLNAATMAFLDNYFIAGIQNTKRIQISALAPDGRIWDPLDFATKEGYSDNIVRVFADNEQLWLFGNDTTEVWVNTGGLFPFSRIPGAFFSIGCDSAWSVAGVTGYRWWLWHGTVWEAGNSPVRVSDYAVEESIKSYSEFDQENCEGFAYIDGGHIFYVLSFPEAGRTWVYEKKTQMWHERLFFQNGQYSRYRPRVFTQVFGRKLVGDYDTGAIYSMDQNIYSDAGGAILRRERICPYMTDEMRNVRYNRFTVDMDTGVGLNVPDGQPGNDPQVLMRYSADRGKTWSNERQQTVGKVGDTLHRVVFPNCGSSRIGQVFSVAMEQPVPFMINAADVQLGLSNYPRDPQAG